MPGVLHGRLVEDIDAGSQLAADADVRVRAWASASHVAITAAKPGVVNCGGATCAGRVVADAASARVVSLEVAGVSVLVAGDLSATDQTDLVSTAGSLELPVASLRADVLVVPHHGAAAGRHVPWGCYIPVSRSSLLVAVTANTIRRSSVLNALSTIGAPTIRTDEDGDVAIVVKSGNLRAVTHEFSAARYR